VTKVDSYEWAEVRAGERDPAAGGASHAYLITEADGEEPRRLLGAIIYQHGPRGAEGSTAGCLDDHVLAIVEDRLAACQEGPLSHDTGARALAHVRLARRALRELAAERRARAAQGRD